MGKKYFNKLKAIYRRLYKKKEEEDEGCGCVAFAVENGTNSYYYAINGKADRKETVSYTTIIEDTLGFPSPFFCPYSDAFTVLQPVYPFKTKPFTDSFYSFLHRWGDYHAEFLFVKKAIRKGSEGPKYSNRYFTCAEKKILGHIMFNSLPSVSKLYTTKPPCLHCLPVIASAYYLFENEDVRHIQNMGHSMTLANGAQVYHYKS